MFAANFVPISAAATCQIFLTCFFDFWRGRHAPRQKLEKMPSLVAKIPPSQPSIPPASHSAKISAKTYTTTNGILLICTADSFLFVLIASNAQRTANHWRSGCTDCRPFFVQISRKCPTTFASMFGHFLYQI